MIKIGTNVEAVKAVEAAIVNIINAQADQQTIQLALNVLLKGVQPTNTTISHNSFCGESKTSE